MTDYMCKNLDKLKLLSKRLSEKLWTLLMNFSLITVKTVNSVGSVWRYVNQEISKVSLWSNKLIRVLFKVSMWTIVWMDFNIFATMNAGLSQFRQERWSSLNHCSALK